MAAINIHSNGDEIVKSISDEMITLANKDKFLKPLVSNLIFQMKDRIHDKGLNSSDQPIGTYSSGYLRRREKAGLSGKKIIVEFTANLANDWHIVDQSNGYGIGFNDENYKKARYVEEIKEQDIFSLSPSDLEFIDEFFKNELPKLL